MATPKQSKAIAIYMENRGTLSVGEAMRQAGYSDASAKNPKLLTGSEDWASAMDRYLPDIELLAVHRDLLESKKVEHDIFPLGLDQQVIKELLESVGCTPKHYEVNMLKGELHVWYWSPDQGARKAALDLAYKLKGKMTQKIEHSGAVDGLFGSDALTITVVDAEHNVQP